MPLTVRLRSVTGGLLAVATLVVTAACGSGAGVAPAQSPGPTPGPTSGPTSGRSSSETPARTSGTPAGTPATEARSATASPTAGRRLRGVDVSHHQGDVDWDRVRGDGMSFAYLKASEGRTFTDPRFVANARGARSAGLRVGGYHYFTICAPGAPQAEHFAGVLSSAPARTLPPAVDLELGTCAPRPPRATLLAEVRAFLEVVEARTGQRVVVYAYPDLESRYRVAAALDRRLWVRRLGSRPPSGEWWMWQRDDRALVDGIRTPADLNVLAP